MVGKPYKRQDIVHLLATRHKKKNFHQKVSHFASLNFQPGGFTNVIGRGETNRKFPKLRPFVILADGQIKFNSWFEGATVVELYLNLAIVCFLRGTR